MSPRVAPPPSGMIPPPPGYSPPHRWGYGWQLGGCWSPGMHLGGGREQLGWGGDPPGWRVRDVWGTPPPPSLVGEVGREPGSPVAGQGPWQLGGGRT